MGVGGGGAAPDARRREQHQPRHEDGDAGAVERHVVRPGRVRQPAYNTTTTGLQHERDDNRRAYNTTTTGLQHERDDNQPTTRRQPACNTITTTTSLQHDDNRLATLSRRQPAYNTTTTDLPHKHDDNQTDTVKVAGSPHSTAERGENFKS